jgi:hypothetical protein
MNDWQRLPDDEYWNLLAQEWRAEDVAEETSALIEAMRTALRQFVSKCTIYDGDRSACGHSALIFRLSQDLRAFNPLSFDQNMFRETGTYIRDHLVECETASAEDHEFEIGLVAYAKVLTNPEDSADARQWLNAHKPTPSARPPSRNAAYPEIVHTIVEVASYLGAAGLGGIVGNRTDAMFVDAARHLFSSVHDRWIRRAASRDAGLSEDEAVDAAKAAAIALEYEPMTLAVISAIQGDDKSWLVMLRARRKSVGYYESLRARIPAGDPSSATILIDRP